MKAINVFVWDSEDSCVPESTEGFRFGAGLRAEIPAQLQVSRVPVPVEKMLRGLLWSLKRERGEKSYERALWGGLKGYIRAGLPWIKPFLCFVVICDIM